MPTEDFTLAERRLFDAVTDGNPLVCANKSREALKECNDEDSTIRGEVLRQVLLGDHVATPDPKGIEIHYARIVGRLDLNDVRSDLGLVLLQCWIDEKITLCGARLRRLSLDGSCITSLDAEYVEVNGSIHLRNNLRASADSPSGAVRLYGARIQGNLELDGSALINRSGPALHAQQIQVDGSVYLRSGFHAVSSDLRGTVWLLGARIGGNLEANGAVLENPLGPALVAQNMQVGGSIYLRDGFRAEGAGAVGAVRLRGTSAKSLDMRDGCVHNSDGVALDLRSVTVDWLRIPAGAACATKEPSNWVGDGQLHLDGLVYGRLAPDGAAVEQWLKWLGDTPDGYAAQPYQQLASVQRAAGHDGDVRTILMAQQDNLLRFGRLRRWDQIRLQILRRTLGYGYQSWRALIGLISILALAILLGLTAGRVHTGPHTYVAAHTGKTAPVGTACSTLEQIGIGVDRGLPLINTGMRDRCDLNTTHLSGQIISAMAWLLQVLAWAMATLVIAGYAGLVRKS